MISVPILILLHLLWQLRRVGYNVRDELAKALGVLRGDGRPARFGFRRFPCDTGHSAFFPMLPLVIVFMFYLLNNIVPCELRMCNRKMI